MMRASFVHETVRTTRWGVAKLVKAPDFDSGIRRFESFFPSQVSFGQVAKPARFHFRQAKHAVRMRGPQGMLKWPTTA
jgi:hypothetical protein